MRKAVYLAGPIFGRSDADCIDWREKAITLLVDRYDIFDPMVRDYRGREMDSGTAALIVEQDKLDISRCAIILVHFDQPSVGTAMEVLYAYDNDLRVLVINASGKPLSPWMYHHATMIYRTLEEACAALLIPEED